MSGRARVPANAAVCYVAVAFLLAATGSFLELVVLSTLAVVGVYILACAAAFWLHRKQVALAGPPLGFRALPVAAGVGLLGMVGLIASAEYKEIAGLVGAVVASVVLYGVMQRVRRA